MNKNLQLISVVVIIATISLVNAKPLSSKDIKKQLLYEDLITYEKELNKKLLDLIENKIMSKRSDVDSRILELQAKMKERERYSKTKPGHGRFNFDEIGKRDVLESNESSEDALRSQYFNY
ncbi:unnamed protein product [Brachionus calyciflorus]|uniref:Uncharacterized protein n=1 Tax=Brachionus calyciflorus TaxID=104777 RepID=A0A813Z6G9_9BILA|nr:unnamed protein product [Brachionus calyciflorus]